METKEHEELKVKLLKKEISFLDVKDRLLELDQNDIYRSASENNLAFLNDDEIIYYIEGIEDEIKNEYYNFLSFTEFHVGQRLAANDCNEIALDHFKHSLEYSEKIPCNDSWNNYIKGTISYLEGRKIDQEIIDNIEEELNAEVLRNFNNGLKKRGYPAYMVDYTK